MIRRRLRPCRNGGKHTWGYAPPFHNRCRVCRKWRSDLLHVVEVAEHEAEHRPWVYFPAVAIFLALVMAGGVLASSQAIAPSPIVVASASPSSSPAPPSFGLPGPTDAYLAAYVAPTWSPPPAPSPTPTPSPTGKLVCPASPSPVNDAQSYLLSRVGRAEYNCGWRIIRYESGWNPANVNPWSGACGMPQALDSKAANPCGKMAPGWIVGLVKGTCPKKAGQDRSSWSCWATVSATGRASPSDPRGQIDWFIRYVQSRYGTMANAAAWEFGVCWPDGTCGHGAHNWY